MEGLRSCMVSGKGEFVPTRCPDGALGVTLSRGFATDRRKRLRNPAAGGFPWTLESSCKLEDLQTRLQFL